MHTEDRLLTIAEAAEILKTSKDYLYRNWKHLPFAVSLSKKQLRFSLKGLVKFIEEKQHHGRPSIS
jgi:hypothetical protein